MHGTALSLQGIDIPRDDLLEEMMVDVAEDNLEQADLAELLYSLAPD